jgi:hypothetical protein
MEKDEALAAPTKFERDIEDVPNPIPLKVEANDPVKVDQVNSQYALPLDKLLVARTAT